MERKRAIRAAAGYILLIVLTAVFFMLNIVIGSSHVDAAEVLRMLTGTSADHSAQQIVMNIRLPRTLAALLLGGALAEAGFLLQSFFANPIAGPFVLGISSGAKLTVAAAMVFSLQSGVLLTSGAVTAAAFAGSLASMGIIMLISGRVKSMAKLIIAGVMIGYICSAVTELIVTFANDANIVNLHNWSMGSFSGISMDDVKLMTVIVLAGCTASFLISKPMGAYQLGEAYAENLGVNIRLFRLVLIVLSSMLSACVTAFAGPVSFVGVAVPHLMKSLMGTAKPIIIVPACFLGGASFCLICDLIARMLFSPVELSISTVTAVFGAPVVIAVMLSRKKGRGDE